MLEGLGFELVPLNVFESAPRFDKFDAPPLGEVDLIVAVGGPQSANDDFPAIHSEREYLGEAMATDVPVFGICLGAQIMSRALGGEVGPTGGYEVGLRKIWVTEEGSRDPGVRQAERTIGTDVARGTVHGAGRGLGAGVRLYAVSGWVV